MKKRAFLFCVLLVFLVQVLLLAVLLVPDDPAGQDPVAVNEVVKTVEADWDAMWNHTNAAGLSYVVLDQNGVVRYRTRNHLSETVFQAAAHGDTILDVAPQGKTAGKVLIYNTSVKENATRRGRLFWGMAALLLLQAFLAACYFFYLERAVFRPFQKLRGFAQRVAGGNLDIPLAMDRHNLFGAFTESFDLMRTELKKARMAEAKANAQKKELVAKLSHDIKTPVASIRAAAEVGLALSESERMQDNYTQIIRKADQIHTLVNDLFAAALKELSQLPVTPADFESGVLFELLENADYLHRANPADIPECLLRADRLRLQQVFDNLFANSYKYAGTDILLSASLDKENGYLVITIEDFGGGVPKDELALLKEKFRRGKNAHETEGAGLGLYISDYFMKEMGGELFVENGAHGLRACVKIAFSGMGQGVIF